MKERYGYAKVEVPEKWNGCLLVNPLCPDDLCWLPAEEGHPHQWHCLGTTPWDYRFTTAGSAFFMSKVAKDPYDLYVEGWQAQFKMCPAELEFRREVWDWKLIEEILAYPHEPDLTAVPKQVDFLVKVRKGELDENSPRQGSRFAQRKANINGSHRSPLMNRSTYHKKKLFPCWCGESMVGHYRQVAVCCVDYLALTGPFTYLDLG